MNPKPWTRKLWLALGGLAVVLLAAAVFTLGSLNTPVRPKQGSAFIVLFALSTFIGAALLVFGLILTRSLLRLWAEQRAGQLGSRFKTKMVLGAMGVSLLPVVFLFFFSYALVNRTLNSWFPRPLEIANEQSQKLLFDLGRDARERLTERAQTAASWLAASPGERNLKNYPELGAPEDAAWLANSKGQIEQTAGKGLSPTLPTDIVRRFSNGAELWRLNGGLYLAGHAPYGDGSLYVGRRLPSDFLQRFSEIETQTQTYFQQRQQLRAYKSEILLALLLITLLLLFATTWVALFLSKQVTVPIQALAQATQEIAHGNFDHRVTAQGHDELGTLVNSFNQMTAQLGEGRRQINEFTYNLQQAFEERERRRELMEAILENIPTGVVSLDAEGTITRLNSAAGKIFGDHCRNPQTLEELFGEEATRSVQQLMRRSLRLGAASREMEIAASGRLVRAAVTVSSLGPRRSNPGFIVVIDDLTELLRAQRAATWQEVAQRIAHEIKNPLTPIQLSAQRLLRHLERSGHAGAARTGFETLVAECANLIEREVRTLESLVDEFSQFARFPAARLAPCDLNPIVESALALFQNRLEGITVVTELAAALPPVKADAELLRRVLVNLIDNAAEAMESSTIRKLTIATRLESNSDAIEIEIADTGHGISPEDKDKLFLPHFSTKERGTGLGLAIVSRIIAEHNGSLRVDDNAPVGARFHIRFPAIEVPAVTTPAGNAASRQIE
jgi:two-component system, NtrC family, nitrogen regulation sensor histidine kinase NtrY